MRQTNAHWPESGILTADSRRAWNKPSAKGFVKTGADLSPAELTDARWSVTRNPYLLETSHPGVFAVGDVRSGNTKRVAAAVGEGSIAIQLVHKVLQEWSAHIV